MVCVLKEKGKTVSIEELDKRVSGISLRMETLEALARAREIEIREIRDLLTDLRSSLMGEVEKLRATSEKSTSRIDKVSLNVKDLAKRIGKLEFAKPEELEAARTKFEEGLGSITGNIETLRGKLTSALGSINKNKDEIDAVEKEFKKTHTDLSKKITNAQKELSSKIKTLGADLNRNVKDLSSTVEEVENMSDAATKEIKTLRKGAKKIDANFKNLSERENKRYKWIITAINALKERFE